MEAIRKYELESLHFPVDGYLFLVKMITSVDGGKTFYYCGNSKYFKTREEAEDWKAEQEAEKEPIRERSGADGSGNNSNMQ